MAGRAAYQNKWQSENCDRINLVVKKGEKERLKAHANERGESLNAFIVRAIRETLERDGEEGRYCPYEPSIPRG